MTILGARRAGLVLIALYAASSATASGPAFADAGKTRLVLLTAGQGKKTKLRFRPKAGTEQTVVMVSGQQMSMTLGSTKLPAQQLPRTVLTMALKVKSIDAQGRIAVAFDTVSTDVEPTPGVPESVMQQMRTSLQTLKALKGVMTIDDRGQVLSADLASPDLGPMQGVFDNLRENMNRLVVPLPSQPVGPGAKWRVVQNLSQLGMPITQEATFTLKKRAGDRVEVVVDMVQKVGAGPVKLPNVPAGLDVRTKPSKSYGKGQLAIDLAKVGATGSLDMDINVGMNLKGTDNDLQSMDMAIKMKLDMKDGATR